MQEAEMDKSTSILIIFGAVLALIFMMPILGAVSLIFIVPPVFIVAINALSDKLSDFLSSNESPPGHFFSAISYYIIAYDHLMHLKSKNNRPRSGTLLCNFPAVWGCPLYVIQAL